MSSNWLRFTCPQLDDLNSQKHKSTLCISPRSKSTESQISGGESQGLRLKTLPWIDIFLLGIMTWNTVLVQGKSHAWTNGAEWQSHTTKRMVLNSPVMTQDATEGGGETSSEAPAVMHRRSEGDIVRQTVICHLLQYHYCHVRPFLTPSVICYLFFFYFISPPLWAFIVPFYFLLFVPPPPKKAKTVCGDPQFLESRQQLQDCIAQVPRTTSHKYPQGRIMVKNEDFGFPNLGSQVIFVRDLTSQSPGFSFCKATVTTFSSYSHVDWKR